jgi:hypothetical protein
MRSGFWKRARVSLVAGALAAIVVSPLASLAASPGAMASVLPLQPQIAQFHGIASCQALGGGGQASSGLQQGGLSSVYSFGAGGFYSPYYNPAYSSYGLGTMGTFLNYSGGQPSPLASLAGSPYCAGLGIVAPAPTGAPFVVRDFGLSSNPIFGFQGAGFGTFGMSPFGMGGVGNMGGFGGFGAFGGFGFR